VQRLTRNAVVENRFQRLAALQTPPHPACPDRARAAQVGTRWVSFRPGFLLPVRVLSRLFRRLFLKKPKAAYASGQLNFFSD
jgi:hypothetical protein